MSPVMKETRCESIAQPKPQGSTGLLGTLRSSAIRALPEAVLVLVLGNVAVGIVGGIWHQMAPSPPPGIHGEALSASKDSIVSLVRWPSIREHQFLIVYLIFLVHNLRLCLFVRSSGSLSDSADSWDWQARRQLWRGWFGLIVANAFGAMFSAIALWWAQQFSLSRIVWQAVLQPVMTQFQVLAGHVFGQRLEHGMADWLNWYSANQFKFNFWFLYIAAICDDLGIPNFKTLGKALYHRIRSRFSPVKTSADQTASPPAI